MTDTGGAGELAGGLAATLDREHELEAARSAVRRKVTYLAAVSYFGALSGMTAWSLWQGDVETALQTIGIMGGPALLIIGYWFGKREAQTSD